MRVAVAWAQKNREAVALPVHASGRCRAARACGACGVAVRARGTSLRGMLRVRVLPNRAAAHPAGRRISQVRSWWVLGFSSYRTYVRCAVVR